MLKMPKKLSAISVLLSSALVVGFAVPMPVYAETDDYEKRDVTAYLFGMEDSATLECLFRSDLPEVPYISVTDYLNNIYTDEFTETKNADHTYTVTNPKGSMIVNTADDTVYFEQFETFISAAANSEGTMLEADYCKELAAAIEGDSKTLTIDFSEYNIDLIEDGDKVYFPLATISDMFFTTYNGAEYIDGSIYFVHTVDETKNSYIDKSSLYAKTERSKEMAKYSYDELCFVMDKIYGRPSKAEIAAVIAEKGFDKTLDEYSESTKTAKELLQSESAADFVLGLCCLQQFYNDGGHTMLPAALIDLMNKYADSALTADIQVKCFLEPEYAEALFSALTPSITAQQELEQLSALRDEKYQNYEVVKSWDGQANCRFLRNGDTGVFVFDSFLNDAVYAFKWSVDYAAENGIRNVLLDISCNTGGSTTVVVYMMNLMTNSRYHTDHWQYRVMNTLTRNINLFDNLVDLNLDGYFDDKDKDVAYDLNFGVLTSRISYSCGNLLPIMANDEGIAILGETSGGGACILSVFLTPEEMLYSLSGYMKFISNDGNDADLGAPVDYDLTKTSVDDDGVETVDYSDFYDIKALGALIDEYYGVESESSQDEPSQDESSQEEPSHNEPSQDEPSQNEPSQNEPSQNEPSQNEPSQNEPSQNEPSQNEPSQTSPVINPGTDSIKTGESGSAFLIILVMLLAAGTGCAVSFRKKTE